MRYLGALLLCLTASSCAWSGGVSSTAVDQPSVTTGSTVDQTPTVASADVAAARDTAMKFAEALEEGDFDAVRELVVDPPSDIVEFIARFFTGIGTQRLAVAVTDTRVSGTWAEADLRYELDLAGFGPFSYDTSMVLVGSGRWGISWTPSILYPSLDAGDTLILHREWSERAPILASDGTALIANTPVKVIGVVPQDIQDLADLTSALESLTGILAETVIDELDKQGVQPDWFVPVGSVEIAAYGSVAAEVEALAGVIVRDGTSRLAVASPLADHLLGATGPITADLLAALGAPYVATDTVGRSGIELTLEEQLAGRPEQSLQRVNQFGRVVETIVETEGVSPQPVQTTLDLAIQRAVESAIADTTDPAAVVVIDVTTGEVRGVASRPLDEFDRALNGRYPPGSTFKIVSAYALAEAGVEPDTESPCPGSVVIDGRTFRTASGRGLGDITFTEAFYESCNTAFATHVTDLLAPGDLAAAANSFGFGVDYGLSLVANGGLFPPPPDAAGRAAASIGQAQVLASPLHGATVAAAIATGSWRAPRLLTSDPERGAIPLDDDAVSAIAGYMRLVITEGTGQAANIDGVVVRGKTGTAQFGTGDELGRHAWFVGYWGDLAIAVVVEGGGAGGTAAAPIAAKVIGALIG